MSMRPSEPEQRSAKHIEAASDERSAPLGPAMFDHVAGQLGAGALQRKLQRRIARRSQPAADGPNAPVHQAAAAGTAGAAGPLPHQDTIQRAFGRHDVSRIQAHTDGAAQSGARAMAAIAFATGDHVAFADAAPDLHTAAHEAAHVVQQRGGVQLKGGVGESDDAHERHADAVADRVSTGGSAEALLDRYADGNPAGNHAEAPVQRLIATSAGQIQATLQPQDLLTVAMGTIGGHITTYNLIAQNLGITQEARIQQQFDQLRVLDRAVHAALGQVSASQFEIQTDPRVVVLHNLLQESEAEHRQLVNTVVTTPNLRGAVDPFDAAHTGIDNDDLTQVEARNLWTSIMDGTGKLKLVGPSQYQETIRSWLTKLMDTKQGRRLLRYLNTGDATDLGTNVYVGQLLNQLPPQVRLVQNASNTLQDANESVAQPLLGVNTKTSASPHPLVNPTQVANANQYNDAVLDGAHGVNLGGQDYAFGQSSGSFVNITGPGALRVAAGVERQNGNNQAETPEIYQPDWVLLGHELGHSANMKAGATTDGRRQMDNPTDVFATTFTGQNDRDTRQNQWYGGSEEYINIVGNEDRLRAQGGLDQRDAHTAPKGREMQRREPQIHAAFAENVWAPQFNATSPTEALRQQQYAAQKQQILLAFTQTPRNPQHLIDATNLGQGMVNFFAARVQARTMSRTGINAVLNGDASRNALDATRPYEATLQAQYDHVKTSVLNELIENPTAHGGTPKAQRIVLFCQSWLALRQAHDAAGLGKQFKYKAWWDKAKRSVHNIGVAIVQGDNARYTRKSQRVNSLRNDYA